MQVDDSECAEPCTGASMECRGDFIRPNAYARCAASSSSTSAAVTSITYTASSLSTAAATSITFYSLSVGHLDCIHFCKQPRLHTTQQICCVFLDWMLQRYGTRIDFPRPRLPRFRHQYYRRMHRFLLSFRLYVCRCRIWPRMLLW